MPLTLPQGLAAAISMGGLPPFLGFLAKEEIYTALAHGDLRSILFTVVTVAGNALMFAIAFAVGLKPFLGPAVKTPKHPHEAPALLWLGPVTLAALGLAGAVFSDLSHRYISSPMASAVKGEAATISISLIPHLGVPLALSALTIVLGVLVYWKLDRARFLASVLLRRLGPGPDHGFDGFISGLVRLSCLVTRILQPGRLEAYVTATFLCLAAILLIPPAVYGEYPAMPDWPSQIPGTKKRYSSSPLSDLLPSSPPATG